MSPLRRRLPRRPKAPPLRAGIDGAGFAPDEWKPWALARGASLLGPPSACRKIGMGDQFCCDKILMADEPGNTQSMDQFPRPFWIAIRYQNFITVASGGPTKFRLRDQSKKLISRSHIPFAARRKTYILFFRNELKENQVSEKRTCFSRGTVSRNRLGDATQPFLEWASVGWGCRLLGITTEKSYSYRKESDGSVILAGIQTRSQYTSL